MRLKALISNSILFAISCVSCLLLAEFILRLYIDELDYLRPELITHPHLRHAIKPHSAGHDRWGFRNSSVPEKVGIVAIGDSFTYGVSATASESWPSWLQRLYGKEVYNLGLGGYSLDDYWWLLQNKVPSLKPKQVYIGVYLGNDLINGSRPSTAALIKETDISWAEYASRNSILYQFIKLRMANILAPFKRHNIKRKNSFAIKFKTHHINTFITPKRFIKAQDLNINNNEERLDVALGFLGKIIQECKHQPFDCIILFIPTKTAVYQPFSEKALSTLELGIVNHQVKSERLLFKHFSALLDAQQQEYIDLLPALLEAASTQALYPIDDDNHFLGVGYRVIASELMRTLQ